MCLWNELFALVLSVESGKLGCIEWWWLEVFITPTTILVVGCSFLLTNTPEWAGGRGPPPGRKDLPHTPGAPRTRHCSMSSACNVSRPLESTVGFVYPCGAPDSPVAHRIVRCDLTLLTVSELLMLLTVAVAWQSTIGEDDRWSWAHRTVRCTLYSPMNLALSFPESG
jgi:hypothetical protein